MSNIFPTILIALQFAASVESFVNKDHAKVVYWLSAVALNVSIVYPQLFRR